MVIDGRQEGPHSVADAAILCCCQMASVFVPGKYAIVTGDAVTGDTGMVKGTREKARGLVTVTAITIGWHMIGVFTLGDYTVVT